MQSDNSPSANLSRSASTEVEDIIQIFVKNVASETIPFSLPPSTTIETLRSLLALRTNLPSANLRLVFAGKHLSTKSSTLADYSITPNSTLHLALPVKSGASRKVRCNFKNCKDAVQRIIGDCDFCKGKYCSKHRLLEDHKCSGLEDCKKESHERNAERLNSERTVAIRGI